MNEDKSITFPFYYFLEQHCIGSLDNVAVPSYSATLIQATDNNEEITHVQFNSLDHLSNYDSRNPPPRIQIEGAQLKLPIVWWKKSWDIYYPKIVANKISAFDERRINNINSENIQRISRWVKATMYLPQDAAIKIAIEMYKTPDKDFFKRLGILIEEAK